MSELVDKIKDLFVLYDEYGSEMPENEVSFLELLLSKALNKGLTIEMLPPETVAKINEIHRKYSSIESFDSDEGDGEGESVC